MTKNELIKALKEFPDDLEVKLGLGALIVCGIHDVEVTDYYDDVRNASTKIIRLNQARD